MRQLFLLIIAFSLISCSALISGATKPMVDCIVAPIHNRELQTLQDNLMTFWSTQEKKWPNNRLALMEFSDSSRSPLSRKFTNLIVRNLKDSVLANYQLIYEESDTTEYKEVLGELRIKISSDSTVDLLYKTERVEMKNGTICTPHDSQHLVRINTRQ